MSDRVQPPPLEAARRAAAHFVAGQVSSIAPHGGGHIHDTYLVNATNQAGGALILQRFNERVFPDISAVMSNIARVTDHARARLAARAATGQAPLQRALSLRRARDGALYVRDADGAAYRAFEYIPGSMSADAVLSARVAFEAGRALGEFADVLRDLPAPALLTTIAGFHDTPLRFTSLRAMLAQDPVGRAREVEPEWEAIQQHADLITACSDLARRGALPERTAHNDAKLDNVLLDAATERALCIVDLDTVMPGYLAHDFGDLVRTTACTGGEDVVDLSRIALRQDYFEALAEGYLQGVSAWLEPEERASLPAGAAWISVELAIRFLTDYVSGDTYFKIDRPKQNLDRTRVQLQLLRGYVRERDAWLRAWDRIAQRK